MISVLTPTVPGRERFLQEAKASVRAQTLQPDEHLVELDAGYLGPGAMLNRLVGRCESDWYAVLPDDDLLDPDHLEALMGHAEEADIVFSWGRIEGSPEREAERYRGPFDLRLLLGKLDSGLRGVYAARKTLWSQQPYPEAPGEDWEWLTTALVFGRARIACVERETWTYRFHGDNLSTIIEELLAGVRRENLLHLQRYV